VSPGTPRRGLAPRPDGIPLRVLHTPAPGYTRRGKVVGVHPDNGRTARVEFEDRERSVSIIGPLWSSTGGARRAVLEDRLTFSLEWIPLSELTPLR